MKLNAYMIPERQRSCNYMFFFPYCCLGITIFPKLTSFFFINSQAYNTQISLKIQSCRLYLCRYLGSRLFNVIL